MGLGLRGKESLWSPGLWTSRWGLPGWVNHLGAGSSASGLGRTPSAPRAPASASKHPPPSLHTGTFRQPLLWTAASFPFFLRTDGRVKHQGPRAVPLAPFTRTLRRLLLPAPGGHWTAKPASSGRGRGRAPGGLLRRRDAQRRIAIGPHGEKLCACA